MNIFQFLEHQIPWVVQAALLSGALLVLAGFAVRRQIAAASGGIVPDEGVTLRNVFEVLVDALASMARETMGDEWRRYFPVVGTIFIFILISNLMGLIPGLKGSTSDINTTLAWAIISFVVYNYVGVKTHGFWYINQFLGPSFFETTIMGKHVHVRLLAPIFFLLEVPLHFARVGTLALRLLANMFADHTVVGVWLGIVPVVVPAIFMGMGVLVACLQAFVFSLLTMIYIGSALEEPH